MLCKGFGKGYYDRHEDRWTALDKTNICNECKRWRPNIVSRLVKFIKEFNGSEHCPYFEKWEDDLWGV